MIPNRLIGAAAATAALGMGVLWAGGAASAGGATDGTVVPAETTLPPAELPAELTAVASECTIVSADVEGGTATFTVGPDGCAGEVGPISFSTYELPSGQRQPYEDQIVIAHAAANGGFYTAGTYTLSASLGDAECWQSDLYFGPSDDVPPLPGLIDYDYHECDLASSAPTTSTAPTTTAPTTTTNPTTTTSAPTTTLAPTTTAATTTTNPNPAIAPAASPLNPSTTSTTNPQVASAGPTADPAPAAQTLPQTGRSAMVLLTAAAGATGIGLLTRRLARR